MSGISLHAPNIDTGKWYCSQAAEEAVQVRTGRGLLHYLRVTNNNAAVRYVYVFDNTASSGTVIAGPIALPATSGEAVLDVRFGIPFETGLRVAASSTNATFTAAAANDIRMTVGYAFNTKRKEQTD